MTVFRIMLGDYDAEEMIRVSRPQAAAWYFGFTWLVNLVMLNMLLAIVMDVYGDVKGALPDNAETIFSQSYETWRRWNVKRKGERLSLDYIAKVLARSPQNLVNAVTGDPILITVRHFRKLVEGLTEAQATRILIEAEKALCVVIETRTREHTIRAVELRVQRLQHTMDMLDGSTEKMLTMLDKGGGRGPNGKDGQHHLVQTEMMGLISSRFDEFHEDHKAVLKQHAQVCTRLEATRGATDKAVTLIVDHHLKPSAILPSAIFPDSRARAASFCSVTRAAP